MRKIKLHETDDELLWYETDVGIKKEGVLLFLKNNLFEIGAPGQDIDLKFETICSSTSGTVSAKKAVFNSEFTGVGGVGRTMEVKLTTDVALGGWANAFKAIVDCSTTGRATGLLSVINAELGMPDSAGGAGTYTIYEAEVTCPASWTGTNNVSVMYIASSGATKANFDTYGCLFNISGVTAAADGFWFATPNGTTDGWLKCLINGTPYYIMLSLLQTEA
jgi:hypothetical protein